MADFDPIKAAEKRGYARGYAAGRRKLQDDGEREAAEHERRERMDRFMCAAMQGLLASGHSWVRGKDQKPDRSPDDFALTAHQIAVAMMRRNP